MENGSLLSLVGKWKMVIHDCCYSKCARLWLTHMGIYPCGIDWNVYWHSKSQWLFSICRPRKTNFSILIFPFTENKGKFVVSVVRLQQTHGSCCFLLVPFCVYIYIETAAYLEIYSYLYIYLSIYLYPYMI